MLPTDQDKLLVSLLGKERLLEIVRYFIIPTSGSRRSWQGINPQAFGIMSMLERVKRLDRRGSRKGDVIWHTTGSGKSFTMVFLAKAL
ncbi:MAG: hypothetical protein ACNI3A_19255 [Desulfovibrio sp.]|uniref:hypothetical protein n=1 Tax=Desulfovibrio sp. 7SRBS1 TaxID=3378064 RepID=UPI003B3ED051